MEMGWGGLWGSVCAKGVQGLGGGHGDSPGGSNECEIGWTVAGLQSISF